MKETFDAWRDRLEADERPAPNLRAIRLRGARLRNRRRALIAAPGMAAVAGSAVLLSTALESSRDEGARPAPAATRTGAPDGRSGSHVQVEVTASGYDGVTVTATPVERVSEQGWMEHDLVFENTDDAPATLSDFRSSQFLPSEADNRLLVADEGCGYGFPDGPSRAVAGVCDLVQADITLVPGERARRSVTLFRDLPGMKPVDPGRYELTKEIAVSGSDEPLRLQIVYDVPE